MSEPAAAAARDAALTETPESRFCSTCRTPMNRLGAQPIRTGGLPGHPDAVLWLDTHWCPRCGRVEFFTIRGPDDPTPTESSKPSA